MTSMAPPQTVFIRQTARNRSNATDGPINSIFNSQ